MFSKPKVNDPIEPARAEPRPAPAAPGAAAATQAAPPRPNGDMQVDGKIEGDIRAALLTVGESAVISGEIIADDVVIHGHIRGRVRGLKVRLTATARVEGDIIHKTIAIESGAHFEGSVQRRDDPLNDGKSAPTPIAAAARPAPKAAEG